MRLIARVSTAVAAALRAACFPPDPSVAGQRQDALLEESWNWTIANGGPAGGLAWGDWDSDGDLDLAVAQGGFSEPIGAFNHVYTSLGFEENCSPCGLETSPSWTSDEEQDSRSVAWADWDGDPDLAVGNYIGPIQVFTNSGRAFDTVPWDSTTDLPSLCCEPTFAIAWGDWDGDGDLDLAEGNESALYGRSYVYENVGGAFSSTIAGPGPEADPTRELAWADGDGDGDLDLALANYGAPELATGYSNEPKVFGNVGYGLSLDWQWPSTPLSASLGLGEAADLGDWDGDGDLDLAVAQRDGTNRPAVVVYVNDGGQFTATWTTIETDEAWTVAWGDWNGDGDLDLAVGGAMGTANRVYENHHIDDVAPGGWMSVGWESAPAETFERGSVAWADVDGDGDLDLADSDGETDEDGDGVRTCEGDCDDSDGEISPGADEFCDGLDTDCNGLADFDGDDEDGLPDWPGEDQWARPGPGCRLSCNAVGDGSSACAVLLLALVPFGAGVAVRLGDAVGFEARALLNVAPNDFAEHGDAALAGVSGGIGGAFQLGPSPLEVRPEVSAGVLGESFHLWAGVSVGAQIGQVSKP